MDTICDFCSQEIDFDELAQCEFCEAEGCPDCIELYGRCCEEKKESLEED